MYRYIDIININVDIDIIGEKLLADSSILKDFVQVFTNFFIN